MRKINWTEEKKQQVLDLVEDFIVRHKVGCGESVIQRDDPNLDSSAVMAEIVDIVFPESEEEDE